MTDSFVIKLACSFQACLTNAEDAVLTSDKASCSTTVSKYSLKSEHEIKALSFPGEARSVVGNQAVT